MLFHKWFSFLMRMMSPRAVGLILFCLIGVSSLSFQLQIPENYSTHPTSRPILKLKRNASHSSFAKDSSFRKTEASTEAPKVSVKVSNLSIPIIGNSSRNGFETKTVPNLNLSLKLKVRNGSETNSTIVYLPRLSRSMTNFSRNPVNKDLQPVIVSSHRRVLLDPKEYTIRSESHTRLSPKLSSTSHSESNLKQKVPSNSTSTKSIKFGFKVSESSPKIIRTFSAQKRRDVFKTESPNAQLSSESTVVVNIKRNLENGMKTSTLQFLPATVSKTQFIRNFQPKQRRRGRNFDIEDTDPKVDQETNPESLISLLMFHETTKLSAIKNDAERSKLLKTKHNFSSSNGESSLAQHLPSPQTEELLLDRGHTYTEKKAKNLTIYEILKPRLKFPSNIREAFDFSPDQNSYSLKNDAASHQIKNIEEENPSNSSHVNIIERGETANNTSVINGIEHETSKYEDSMGILPGRSDSRYDIEYVMINRNSSTLMSPSNATEPSSNTTAERDKESNRTATEFIEQSPTTKIEADNIQKRGGEINETNIVSDEMVSKQDERNNSESSYMFENASSTTRYNTSQENISADGSEYMTLLYESDSIRRPKMSENVNSNNEPFKNPKIDSKMFYDYFAKKPIGNATLQDFPFMEYRPGNMFRYSDVYQRKPILDVVYPRSTPIIRLANTDDMVTEESVVNPTTFNSLRTSVRVLSTYYPNRMQDVTMKFGNRIESTTVPTFHSNDKRPEYRNEDDPDDAEYRDSIDPGFTMEKLAYLLIGTCCGLSILCLFVVVIAIKCRRAIVEKRLKAQFRKQMYHHERMKDMATPWQQQMFDHFMYLHRRPGDSSCSSNTDSCNCRCVTWSLGARNLDATRPLCPPTGRSSLYLYGQKKLPFGAASTLRFESMLARKRSSPENNHQKADSPNTDSSHENDSLDLDSDSREGDGPKQCTCIDYNVWPMPPTHVPRGFYTLCPNAGRYNAGNCSQHAPVELRTIARDVPPPVTGSNYLDRSEGVVYWSSNEERLI